MGMGEWCIGRRCKMGKVRAHFVTFYSPGTFFAENTTKPIKSWHVATAIRMARKIKERYNATPYAFQFSTNERGAKDLNSKEVKRSGMYYLGGKIETLAEVKARNDPAEEILRMNMEGNGWHKIIVNTNSWRVTQPLRKNDVILDFKP